MRSCDVIFRLVGRRTNGFVTPQSEAKNPAMIEELRFTYPNISDSQHAPEHRQGVQNRKGFNEPNTG
jgi:hypothetical protein